MNENEHGIFGKISGYYNDLVNKHGHSHSACDYGHPNSQRIKFEVLSEVTSLSRKRLLDVGCGLADYRNFLSSRFDSVDYTGVDISPRMVEEAQRSHPNEKIILMNILESDPGTFDVVTANGIFYLLGEDARKIMESIIARMFSLASEAVAFNSLSCWAPDPEEKEFYADPRETIEFCRTLSPWVVLRHDYHPRDFTVYLYKKRKYGQ